MRAFALTWVVSVFVCGSVFGVSFRTLSELPADLRSPSTLDRLSGNAQPLEERLVFQAPKFERLLNRHLAVSLEGSKHIVVENMPALPFVQRRFELPPGKTGQVVLEDAQVEESREPVDLKKEPETLAWSKKIEFAPPRVGKWFPGKIIDYREADGALWINVFPVQYDRESGRVLILRSGNLRVIYRDKSITLLVPHWKWPESIIVTGESLRQAAELLQAYHEAVYGVQSQIVTVEEIDKAETPVDDKELPPGYKDADSSSSFVVYEYDPKTKSGYNYTLAKKIIQFLHRRVEGDVPTRYVTLLGDSNLVPPSYYFSVGSAFGSEFGVTDQCYGAIAQCKDPRMAVGRLPLKSLDQLTTYLKKVSRWLKYTETAASELSLWGGKAFQGVQYIGEMGTLRTIEPPYVTWRGVKKYFRTRGDYTRDSMLNLVSGRLTSSFIYHLDHGMGNQWFVENQFVSAKEVLAIDDPGSEVNPVIASVSCTNAAFDKPLVKESIFGSSEYGDESVGVALIQSKAGAIGYLGSARPAIGQPTYNIDEKGNLEVTGTTYALQLLDTFFDRYHQSMGGRLGDSLLKTLKAYAMELGNDMTNDRHVWTYFNFAFLGDPVIKLPWRNSFENAYAVPQSVTQFEAAVSSQFPLFRLRPNQENPFVLNFQMAIPASMTLHKVDQFMNSEIVIDQAKLSPGQSNFELQPTQDLAGLYMLKLENSEGIPRERRVWFEVSPAGDRH